MPRQGRGKGASSNCAYCRVRGNLCDPTECPMAPYFSAAQIKDYRKARSVFGVRRMRTMLDWVKPGEERLAVAETLLFEAVARKDDPLGGSLAIILRLKEDVKAAYEALKNIKARLAEERAKQLDHDHHQPPGNDKKIGSSSGTKEEENLRDYPDELDLIEKELELLEQEIAARKLAEDSIGKEAMVEEGSEKEEYEYDDDDDDDDDDDEDENEDGNEDEDEDEV